MLENPPYLPAPKNKCRRSTVLTLVFILGFIFYDAVVCPKENYKYLSLQSYLYYTSYKKDLSQSYLRKKHNIQI